MKDTVVFSFGRFNPPTSGHEKLMDKVAAVAKKENADFMVFPSHSQNPKKDPLSHKDKVNFMRKMFPRYKGNIMSDKGARTAFNIVPILYDKGYKRCIMVVGGDRVVEFKKTLNKYNGVKGKHGFYDFENGVEIVSAGERDPDAEGVTGMSASKMRAAAAANDYDSFEKGLPSGYKEGEKVFDAIRKGMNLSEEMMEFLESGNQELKEFLEDDFMQYLDDMSDDEVMYEISKKKMESVQNGLIGLDQIKKFESVVDKLFAKYDIDFNFTRHFGDRMDDSRNNPSITLKELAEFIKKMYKRQGKSIKGVAGAEAVLKDIQSDLNIPVAVTYDSNNDEFDVVLKTIMRKKNFTSPDKVIKYESTDLNESALQALRTATKAHKGQFRKSGGEYIAHPKEVAKIVAKFKSGSSKLSALVQAAYLHDTIEDTNLTHEDLVKQFGGLVANLVNQLTTKKDDLEAAGGKGEYIKDKMVNMTSWALVIKLADRLANVSDIATQSPAWQKKYGGDTKLALDAVKKDRKDLSPTHRKIIKNIEKIIEPYVSGKVVQEVKQDSDIEDKKGSQPAKYYASDADGDKMSKSTKDKRAAHFNKNKKGPAPGDKGAKTKESEHTKRYRQMYGEGKNLAQQAAIAIAKKKSGKYDKDGKRIKKEAGGCWDGYTPVGMKKKGNKMVPNCVPEETINEKIDGLVKKSEKSGISYGILKKVYDRGMAAWKGGHRPGTTPQQWAFARVNSFITKGKGTWGKADSDLASKVRKEELDVDSTVSDYVKDFKKSNAPQFKGKSTDKRKQMAIAAYLAAVDKDK